MTIGGNLILGSATVTEAQAEILDGATITTTELNLIDGGATVGTTAIADGDGLLINDAGTMRVTTVQTLAAYLDDEITAMGNLVETGALDAGSISSGFGNIDNGASNITSGGLVHLDVDSDADDISGDSATGRLTLGVGQDLNLYHGGTHSYIVNDTGSLFVRTGGSDADVVFVGNDGGSDVTALTLDMSAAGTAIFNNDVTVGDNLNLTTDSTVINFGADSDTTLTHTDGTGLTLNSTNKLCFNDASQYIQGASNAILDIAATDEIELTATLIDIVGNSTVSGTLVVAGTATAEGGQLTTTGKALVFGF